MYWLRRHYSEEGARFPISMVSSGVWAGDIPLEKAHSLKEVGGSRRTMRQELERIGYLGKTKASFEDTPIGVSLSLCLALCLMYLTSLGSLRVTH